MYKKNVVVSGGTGFIGSHLVDRLADRYNVYILSQLQNVSIPGARTIWLEGANQDLAEKLREIQPSLCIHLATKFLGTHSYTQIGELVDSNIKFGAQLAEACLAAQCRKFLNIGTVWQNLGGNGYNPVNLYAATKEAFMTILKYYSEVHGLQVFHLKLSDSYGENDTRKKIVELLLNSVAKSTPLRLSGGEQFVDLVHVKDIVAGILLACEQLEKTDLLDQTFFLTSGSPLQLKALGRLIEEILKKPLNAEWGALPYRPREVFNKTFYEPRLPGWEPRISLRQGVEELWSKL